MTVSTNPSTKGSAEALHGYQPGLTIGQVASRMNVSPSTVRRWVRSGRLPSTQVTVGDGFEYRVSLEALEGVEGSVNPSIESSVDPSMKASADGSMPGVLEASVERSTALAAYNAQLLAPFVTVIERQAEQLVSQSTQLIAQAEMIGELRTENSALRASQATLDASTATQAPDPSTQLSRRWWQSWTVYGVVGLLAVVLIVAWLLTR